MKLRRLGQQEGFTLIETLVASAVAAMAIAAAASSVAAAHRLDGASRFYREAFRAASTLHAWQAGAVELAEPTAPALPPMTREEQVIAASPVRNAPGWTHYRIEDPATGRHISTVITGLW